ncbi:MAG: hypothetical protein LBJ59_04165 [Zoogloeaceae bacterium]|jgi:hypothetical protein|nr:hypothetical protein [Zoogloeaceae bacterium]
MKVMKVLGLLFFCALTGCAIQPVEEAQEGVPRARLRVIVDDRRGYTMGYPGSSCAGDRIPGFGSVTSGGIFTNNWDNRSLGMPDSERIGGRLFAEIHIEANKSFVLQYRFRSSRFNLCDIAGSFIPQKNADYEARTWVDWNLRQCIIGLSVRAGDGQWISVPILRADQCSRR